MSNCDVVLRSFQFLTQPVSLARPGCLPIAQSPTPNSYLKERDRSRPLMFLANVDGEREPRSRQTTLFVLLTE
jgi:hypothetical protein